MKRGIDYHPDYDCNGRWCLEVTKKRGKLTLDEIREAARECEYDFYLLVLDCFHDENDDAQFTGSAEGDKAVLYRTDAFYKEGEH